MLASARRFQIRLARARDWSPPAALVLALASLFVFGAGGLWSGAAALGR